MLKKYLYFISAGHMSVDLTSGALPAILPFLVTERGMTYTQVAGLIFASAFLSSLLQPVFGYLADRVTRHWFMGAGIAISGLAMSTIGFFEEYWSIFVAISIMGVGSSMFHPEAARLVNLISGEHRGEGMAIFSVGGNAGFGVGPILAVAMLSLFGLKGVTIFAIIGLGMGFATALLVPKIVKISEHKVGLKTTIKKSTSSRPNAINDWPAFMRLTIILIGRSTIFSGIMTFLPLYCIYNLSISNETGSSLLSVYAVIGIFMTMLGGRLADRFDLISVIRVCTLCYVPALMLIIVAPKLSFVIALILPIAFATHGSYSPFVVLGQTYLAKSIGFASGVTLGLSTSLGGVISPLLGYFADSYGIEMAMYILVAIGFICTMSSFILPHPKKS